MELLESEIVDQRKFQDLKDLKAKAKTALDRTRDSLAKQGGSVIAKGYK